MLEPENNYSQKRKIIEIFIFWHVLPYIERKILDIELQGSIFITSTLSSSNEIPFVLGNI